MGRAALQVEVEAVSGLGSLFEEARRTRDQKPHDVETVIEPEPKTKVQ